MMLRKTALALTLAGLAQAASAADGWRLFPIFSDPDHKLEPTLAVTGSSIDPNGGKNTEAWGLDFNFNCGLIQSPGNRIRTHLNYTHSNEGGVTVNGFELSPRFTVPVAEGVSLGIGPSLGTFKVDGGSANRRLYGVGLAGGINYRVGRFYAGADLRYHATGERSGVDYDPTTLGLKVGFNF